MKRPRPASSAWLLLGLSISACGGGPPIPTTRPIILYSGERLRADPERMAEVDQWVLEELEEIEFDPSFLIRIAYEDVARYPWDTLDLIADTADIRLEAGASDAETPYQIYAHLRLVQARGELTEWVPEAEGLTGYEAERAILRRVSDVWLLGRTVYDTQPFGPLDELLWSHEAGYLEDFMIATQGDRFPEAMAAYQSRASEREEVFREWFQRTFERDGPGFLPGSADSQPATPASNPA
jgi:hypothetical protein